MAKNMVHQVSGRPPAKAEIRWFSSDYERQKDTYDVMRHGLREDARGGGSFRRNLGPEMSPNAEPKPRGPALAGASETPWTETYAKAARVLRAARKPLDAMFGEPGSPTKLGRAMDATAEGLGVALMTHGAAATRLGGVRVLRKAGWQRGPFGWGVETRGDATLRPAAVFGGVREGRLGDVAYVHPDVAKAYPAMEDVPVKLVPSADWRRAVADARAGQYEGSTGFSVRGGNGPVYIRGPMKGEDLGMFAERADGTLVHEMQHIAQDVDGVPGHAYARSNPGYATSAREVEARNSANRRWLTPEERIEMPRSMTQDVRPEDVHLDDKGGEKENYHRDFTNFLATDEVPETLFGYPVVQDERGYTESDLRFFQENPRAAGFYDTGEDEEDDGEYVEDVPAIDIRRAGQEDAKGGRSVRADAGDGAGETEKKKKSMINAFEATPGTETDFIALANGVPHATAAKIRKFAASTRIKSHLTKNQRRLHEQFDSGKIGLESLPVTTSGRYTFAPVEPSRKERVKGKQKGAIRVVGKATKYSNLGHVSESKRLAEKAAKGEYVVKYGTSRDKEFDRDGRSAAMPGDSSIVLHRKSAFEEEGTHLITRPAVPSGLSSDAAMALAKKDFPGISGDAAYRVLGDRNERFAGQAMTKHAFVRMRPDLVSANGQVLVVEKLLGDPEEIKRLREHSEANSEDGRAVKAVLDEYELIKEKKENGDDLDPREEEFWKDMNDQEVWDQLAEDRGRGKGGNIA